MKKIMLCALTTFACINLYANSLEKTTKSLISLKTKLTSLSKELKNIDQKKGQSSTSSDHRSTIVKLDTQQKVFDRLRKNLVDKYELIQGKRKITDLSDLDTLKKITFFRSFQNKTEDLNGIIAQLPNLKEIDLDGKGLTEIPESIFKLKKLKELSLIGNQIQEIPQEIKSLATLEELNLKDNQITALPQELAQLQKLKKLILDNNRLKSFTSLSSLNKLEELSLSGNQLKKVPQEILAQKLTYLNLSNNQLTTLPDSIGNIKTLQTLSINNNKLTQLPETLTQLQDLTLLNLTENPSLDWKKQQDKSVQFTMWISQLKKVTGKGIGNQNKFDRVKDITPANLEEITSLDLTDNNITEIPDSIDQLTNLTSLTLHNNKLTTLPETIGSLKELKSLYVSDNQLTTLPDSIGNIKTLQTLSINNNKLTQLPATLTQLQDLTLLNLTENPSLDWKKQQDKSVQFTMWISQLKNVTGKGIGNQNKFDRVEDITPANLEEITSLDLTDNNITEIPDSIDQLTNLTSLTLHNNKLTTLPETIGSLKELKSLYVSDNQLTTLPDSIGNIKTLQTLSINNNKLTQLPATLTQLQDLTLLNLTENPSLDWKKQQDKSVQFTMWISQLKNVAGQGIGNQNKFDRVEDVTPANLEEITILDLSSNELTEIPESIDQLTNLTSLTLHNNKLTTLPETIGSLKELKSLYVSDNQLTTLPDSIGNIKTLQTLSINNNKLTQLPATLAQLQNISWFNIKENPSLDWKKQQDKSVQFTMWISQLKNVTGQGIGNQNKFDRVEDVTPANLEEITSLDLSSNELTEIPESIDQLTNLTSLTLHNNKLTTLPDAIGNLKALKFLYISDNKLTTLPDSIGNLNNLANLAVAENSSLAVPNNVLQKLTALIYLTIQNTKIDAQEIKKIGFKKYEYGKGIYIK